MSADNTIRRNRRAHIPIEFEELCIDHDLSLYYPQYHLPTLDYEVFKKVLEERLNVMRVLEVILPKVRTKNLEDQKSAVLEYLQKHGFNTFPKLLVSCGHGQTGIRYEERLADHASHIFARVVCSEDTKLANWFVNRESELFRLRFHSLDAEGFTSFLKENKCVFTPISDEEKRSVLHELVACTANMSETDVEASAFYKVPYVDVINLVSTRDVYVDGGYAYIPSRDVNVYFCAKFKAHLCRAVKEVPVEYLYCLKIDSRLTDSINLVRKVMQETKIPESSVIAESDLDALSRASFPPCMRQMHEHIRRTHHAKHGVRMQYGLFLKGIGLPLTESLEFWSKEFTKIMDKTRFQKEYVYHIRHNYGLEGKRISYHPYSCANILSEKIGVGDCHGCPFKHNSAEILEHRFERYGISQSGREEILQLVSEGQHQLACTKYFERTHNYKPKKVVTHPNDYFRESRRIRSILERCAVQKGNNAQAKAGEGSNVEWYKKICAKEDW